MLIWYNICKFVEKTIMNIIIMMKNGGNNEINFMEYRFIKCCTHK